MENWIHEISKSYISSFSPKRKDLMENYVSLNEEQKLELFSQNVNSYLQEQFKNAFGFDINELSEENIESFLSILFEFKGAEEVAARTKEAGGNPEEVEQARQTRKRRLDKAAQIINTDKVPPGSEYVGYGWKTADGDHIPRRKRRGPEADLYTTAREQRTELRLDAAQQGDDALHFAKRGDPAARPTRQGAERSERLAKEVSKSREFQDDKEQRGLSMFLRRLTRERTFRPPSPVFESHSVKRDEK